MIDFIERPCPICDSTSSENLVEMNIETLLLSNPGYIKDWFTQYPKLLDTSFPFVKCKKCCFVYSQYKLSDELTYEYYNHGINAKFSESKIYKSGKRNQQLILWQKLLNLSKLDSPIKVLDYGAGWGDFLAIAKCIGVEVIGLEFDQRKIGFAQKNGIPCGDFEFIERKAPYDIFMCNQVLEHLDNPKKALIKLRSLLVKGAIGYVSVPDFPLEKINDQVNHIKNGLLPIKDFDPLGHLNYFDVNSFRKLLVNTGFEEIAETYPSNNTLKKMYNLMKGNKINKVKEVPNFFVRAK